MDKLVTLGVVEGLQNSDFILESQMVELSQNKYSKQPHRPYAVWKLYFTLKINKEHIQYNCLQVL